MLLAAVLAFAVASVPLASSLCWPTCACAASGSWPSRSAPRWWSSRPSPVGRLVGSARPAWLPTPSWAAGSSPTATCPGLLLVGSGGTLNAIAIVANGLVMPASPSALARAGLPATLDRFTNSVAVADPALAALGDVWAIPSGLPLAGVFSAGDVVIALGAL
jgi:Family of unknown function (DUF5317)